MNVESLYHHGIKGQKWGVRNGPPYPLESNSTPSKSKKVTKNADGSYNVPTGFSLYRVGKSHLDVNKSGALYVSCNNDDAARYLKALGPTLMGKLLGTAGEAIQHIDVTNDIKLASDEQTAEETAKILLSDKKLFDSFNQSIYSSVVTGDFTKDVSESDLKKALSDPSGKDGQKLAYALSSILADPDYSNEAKTIYAHFRNKGYDAIPDLHDTLSGTSETATIIINPNKLTMKSSTPITKDVMKAGKKHLKKSVNLKLAI